MSKIDFIKFSVPIFKAAFPVSAPVSGIYTTYNIFGILKKAKFDSCNSDKTGLIVGNFKQMLHNNGAFLFTLFVFLGISLAGLFAPLVENAAKYAQVSREICDSGNWLELTIAHAPYIEKPPLLFWLGAISFRLFGVSDFVFRIPVLLFSILGIYSTYRLGGLISNKNTGRLAAIFWATSVGFLYFHSDIHTDTLLADFAVLSLWQFSAFFREKKARQFLAGSIALGLAMLCKGPFGLAVPVLALLPMLVVGKNFREIFHPRWFLTLLIIFVVISPSLYGLYKQFGTEGIRFYFWTNNVGRMTGSYRSSGNEPLFYLQNSLLTLFPWVFFVFTGIGLEIRSLSLKIKNRQSVKNSGEIFLLGGTLLFLIILSAASQQNPHYMLPAMPLLMIIAAKWITPIFEVKQFCRLKKIINCLNLVFAILISISIFVLTVWAFPEKRGWFWISMGAAVIVVAIFAFKAEGIKRQLYILSFFTAILFFSFFASIYPSMLKYHSTFEACYIFNRQASPAEKLYSYRVRHWSLFFYSKNYGEWLPDENRLEKLTANSAAWIYTDEYGLNQLKTQNFKMEIAGTFNHRTITGQSLKFINPSTRNKLLEKYYLVRLLNPSE